MTNPEVLKLVKSRCDNCEDSHLCDICEIRVIKEALSKQIPTKPATDGYFKHCPVCACEIILNLTDGGGIDYECNYCPDCGQAIDWSDGNGTNQH